MPSLICGILSDTNELTKQKENHRQRMNLELLGRRDIQGVWDGYAPTAVFKWITDKDLLYSTRNSTQCYVAAWMGGEFTEEWMHAYV